MGHTRGRICLCRRVAFCHPTVARPGVNSRPQMCFAFGSHESRPMRSFVASHKHFERSTSEGDTFFLVHSAVPFGWSVAQRQLSSGAGGERSTSGGGITGASSCTRISFARRSSRLCVVPGVASPAIAVVPSAQQLPFCQFQNFDISATLALPQKEK